MMLTFGKRCNQYDVKIDSHLVMVNKINLKVKMEEIKMKWSNMILAGFGFGMTCFVGLKCVKQYKEHEKIIAQIDKDTKEVRASLERFKEAEDKRIRENESFIRKMEEEYGILPDDWKKDENKE